MRESAFTRLLHNLSKDPGEFAEVEGLEETPEAWQTWARGRGYDLSLDEARELLHSRQELDDDDLERVAGGWDGSSDDGSGDGEP